MGNSLEKLDADLVVPSTPDELGRYFDLRWRVLRAPWNQPRGSERDEREDESLHLMVRAQNGDALAVGRLHLNSPSEAQVRFMAVAPHAQNRGLGGQILKALEQRAWNLGANTIVLNARESAQRFYKDRGYYVEGPAEKLFGGIDHLRMRKDLVASGAP